MDAAKLNNLIVERTENLNINHEFSAEPMAEKEWERAYCHHQHEH